MTGIHAVPLRTTMTAAAAALTNENSEHRMHLALQVRFFFTVTGLVGVDICLCFDSNFIFLLYCYPVCLDSRIPCFAGSFKVELLCDRFEWHQSQDARQNNSRT
jgi:hypothetical protein